VAVSHRVETDLPSAVGGTPEAMPSHSPELSVDPVRPQPTIAMDRPRVVAAATPPGPSPDEVAGRFDGTAPVVHVSIGRIEVRAVREEPPIAPTPPALRRPDLSLDDYLRMRQESAR
jgi:hypothetical protein